MRILVTGGAGFIGSHVVDGYLSAGHEVAIIDNLSTGFESNINPQAVFYKGDIRDYSFLNNVFANFNPDIVNHHAAQMDVRISTREPKMDAEINILGSLNLILLSVEYSIYKFIYISTGGAVYGEPQHTPVTEEHAINPLSQYGISKHTVEHYLYLYERNYGLRYTVLRYPNVFGPRQNPHGEAGVIAIFGQKIVRGERPVIFGDGKQTRDYVYIADVVKANLSALTKGDGGVYNIGSGIRTSVLTVFETICSYFGRQVSPIFTEERVGEIRDIALDASSAASGLSWKVETPLQNGIYDTMRWLKELHA